MTSKLQGKVDIFNNAASNHKQQQDKNPFSKDDLNSLTKQTFTKDEYGRPEKGSKSEARGFQADHHIWKEMMQLCEMIHQYGRPLLCQTDHSDPSRTIKFGELFLMYTVISDKLVGMLLRARKYKLVEFDGEVLYQRRDDDVPITLIKSIDEIKQLFGEKINDPNE